MIKKIAQKIKDAGGTAYYVGGYVRDELLDIENKDIDIEVYHLTIDELEMILSSFGKVKIVGKSFGVLKLDNYDFSIPRSEIKTGFGHTGFNIVLDPFSPVETAYKRRDITINTIMKNVLTSEIIDPYNGVTDLKNKIIKHVNDETFVEDPLRVLRVAQFASRFDFVVSSDTIKLCKRLVSELNWLTPERIFIELKKMLMKGIKPSMAFEYLNLFGALEVLFPELYNLIGLEQGNLYHAEGDAFQHTMLAIDYIPVKQRKLNIMLAILLHDLGKVSTGERASDGRDHVNFHGHPKASVPLAKQFLRRVTNDAKLIENVLQLVEHHMEPYHMNRDGNVNKNRIRRLSLKVDITDLMQLHITDKCSRILKKDMSYVQDILDIYNEVKNEIQPIIKGRHLIEFFKMTPGKQFGKILKEVYEVQLDGMITSIEEGISWIRKNLTITD